MGYVAVRGGGLAIEESLKLLERERVEARMAFLPTRWKMRFPVLWNR